LWQARRELDPFSYNILIEQGCCERRHKSVFTHCERAGISTQPRTLCLGVGPYSYRTDFRLQGLGGQHSLDLLDCQQVVGASGRVKEFYLHSSSPPEVSSTGHAAGACCRRCFSSALHFRKSAASSDSSRSSSRILVRTSANFVVSSLLTDAHASTLRARRLPNSLISRREKPSDCIRQMKWMRSIVVRRVQPEAPRGSHRFRKQSALLIKADRIDRQLSSFCNFADL